MRKFSVVAAACALLVFAGCGGVAELDPSEVETVNLANESVAEARSDGSLTLEGEERLTKLIRLCREKPLSDFEGQSMREYVGEVSTQLEGAAPKFSRKLKRVATNGCD